MSQPPPKKDWQADDQSCSSSDWPTWAGRHSTQSHFPGSQMQYVLVHLRHFIEQKYCWYLHDASHIQAPPDHFLTRAASSDDGSSRCHQISYVLPWKGIQNALVDLMRGAEVLDKNIAPGALAKAEGPRSHHRDVQFCDKKVLYYFSVGFYTIPM